MVATVMAWVRSWRRWLRFPSALRETLIGGYVGGASGSSGNLVPSAVGPTYLYSAGDRGPPTKCGWPPDQGASHKGPGGLLGPHGKEINLTDSSPFTQSISIYDTFVFHRHAYEL
jgi:hypothetical protein